LGQFVLKFKYFSLVFGCIFESVVIFFIFSFEVVDCQFVIFHFCACINLKTFERHLQFVGF